MSFAANLPEQPIKHNKVLKGIKSATSFIKSVLYLTKKIFML